MIMRTNKEDTAILIDGGFLKHSFTEKFTPTGATGRVYITVDQVLRNAALLCDKDRLFRIYYYDAAPYAGAQKNPVSSKLWDFSKSKLYSIEDAFQHELARSKKVAFRKGHLAFRGWELKKNVTPGKALGEKDISPNFEQKMVDMKIGLDISWLAIKRIIDRIIIVTGDSDFVPVMKFARKEGVEVVLCSTPGSFKSEMLEHADEFIGLNLIQ